MVLCDKEKFPLTACKSDVLKGTTDWDEDHCSNFLQSGIIKIVSTEEAFLFFPSLNELLRQLGC